MNDFVQQIKLGEIIPNNIEFDENSLEMQNLTESIKKHGIIEPLLLRPNNGKYEILLGNKRYEIAKRLKFVTVPALVKDVDEELYQEYKKLNNINQNMNNNNNKNKFINPTSQYDEPEEYPQNYKKVSIKEKSKNNVEEKNITPINSFNNRKDTRNSDIINLSELNKEEYEERDENKMNNNMPNNQGVSAQNLSNPAAEQAPSFGGRFFPSLEDEPTNMNMETTNIIGQAMKNATPINQTPNNSNLIDLTDLNGEMPIPEQPNQTLGNMMPSNQMPTMDNQNQMINNSQSEINTPQYTQGAPNFSNTSEMSQQQEFSINMPSPIQDPVSDMNMQQSSLEQNNNFLQPTPSPIDQNNQVINDFNNNATIDQPVGLNQFDMSQSMIPEQNMNMQTNLETPSYSNEPQMPVNNFEIPQKPADIPNEMPQMPLDPPQIDNNIPNENMIQNMNMPVSGISNEQINSLPKMNMGSTNIDNAYQEQPNPNRENVEPVINTLKGLVTNLQGFGYDLNLNEEESDSFVKLTIEIKK